MRESSPGDHFARLIQALAPNCPLEEPVSIDCRQSVEISLTKLKLVFKVDPLLQVGSIDVFSC